MEGFEPSFESQITDETFALSRQSSSRTRAKTSQRLKYEAETQVFKRELGGIEDIRLKLGFSRRKICQILKVDPSAWTRWTGENSDAPPHIYQALKWYMDSKSHQTRQLEIALSQLVAENQQFKTMLERLERKTRRFGRFVIGFSIVLAAAILMAFLNLRH